MSRLATIIRRRFGIQVGTCALWFLGAGFAGMLFGACASGDAGTGACEERCGAAAGAADMAGAGGSSSEETNSGGSGPAGAGASQGLGGSTGTGTAATGGAGGSPLRADATVSAQLDGPAAALFIDASVHQGEVWGEPFDFKMSNYPLSWAIAVAHASLLLRSQGIQYSPNAILSVSLKESRLHCPTASDPNPDGCFQIEAGSAYPTLQAIFPERFVKSHAEIVSGPHYETGALALVHYNMYATASFRRYTADPQAFFRANPDVYAQQKVLNAAYNRGLWWDGLRSIFSGCASQDVFNCFTGVASDIALDHAKAIGDYTVALDHAPLFDPDVRLSDIHDYWSKISPLYGEVDDGQIRQLLASAVDQAGAGGGSFKFQSGLPGVLGALIAALPPVPTANDVAARICKGNLFQAFPGC
jgi:hypothetical protein